MGMVVGIDASLTHCAVAFGTGLTSNPDGVFVLGSEPAAGLMPRLLRYQTLVDGVMRGIMDAAVTLREGPSLVLIESYSHGSAGDAVISLAEFGGLLRMAISKRYRILEVSPSQVKKFALGKGVGSKQDVALGLIKSFGWDYSGDGASDKYEASACWAIARGIIAPQASEYSKARLAICEEVAAGPKPKARKGGKRGARG